MSIVSSRDFTKLKGVYIVQILDRGYGILNDGILHDYGYGCPALAAQVAAELLGDPEVDPTFTCQEGKDCLTCGGKGVTADCWEGHAEIRREQEKLRGGTWKEALTDDQNKTEDHSDDHVCPKCNLKAVEVPGGQCRACGYVFNNSDRYFHSLGRL